MIVRFFKFYLVMLVILFSACSTNLYEGLASKTTDEALYEDAVKLLDAEQYAESVEKFEAMGVGFSSATKVREQWAGALAGRCGFNFINYLTYIGADIVGSPTFFQYLVHPWSAVATDPDSCIAAEAKIKEIWVDETPTASQQLFMSILSLAKIGSVLRYVSDNNIAVGDGTTDVEFNSCTVGADADNLTDNQVKEVVTGISLFLQNIVGFTASLSGDVTTLTASLNAACALMTPNPCNTVNASGVTAPMVLSTRKIISHVLTGIGPAGPGSCVAPDPNSCCP